MSFMSDVATMENERLGGDYYDGEPIYKKCPVCGYKTEYYNFKGLFFHDEKCVGCTNCLTMVDKYGEELTIEGVY